MKNTSILPNQPIIFPPSFPIATESGHSFEVPADGSLGLLALGYTGLMAWRNVRRHSAQMMVNTYSHSLTQPHNET